MEERIKALEIEVEHLKEIVELQKLLLKAKDEAKNIPIIPYYPIVPSYPEPYNPWNPWTVPGYPQITFNDSSVKSLGIN